MVSCVITTYWRKIIFTITCVCRCIFLYYLYKSFFLSKEEQIYSLIYFIRMFKSSSFSFFFFFFSSCFFFCTDVRQKRKEKSNHIKPKALIYCQLYFLSYAYLLSFSSVCILFVSLNTHTHTHTDSYLSVCIFRRNHF